MKRFIAIAAGAADVALAGGSPAYGEDSVAFEGELHHFSPPAGSCANGVCNFTTHGYGTVNIMATGAPFPASAQGHWTSQSTVADTVPGPVRLGAVRDERTSLRGRDEGGW